MKINIFNSNILTSSREKKSLYLPNVALCFDETGKIIAINSLELIIEQFPNTKIRDLTDKIIIPGLIDLHTHLPQYENIGIYKGELLDWLNELTFPTERKFEDNYYAEAQSSLFFTALAKAGTTTACVYSTVHYSATDIAFKEAQKSGLRILMGNTMMDMNAPEYLFLSAAENIKNGEKLANKWHNCGKLEYIVTPRFAGSCSPELLEKAGNFANSNYLYIQTHLSENRAELDFIHKLYPHTLDYFDVYEKYGLANERSIFAHSIYLNQREIDALKSRKCSIAHCPCSNRFLGSGIMPLKTYLDNDIKVGLGSDVSGGYSLSIINEMRESIENSKILEVFSEKKNNVINPELSFYLATLGGAVALGKDCEIGSLENGKQADFVIIDPQFDIKNQESEYITSKLIYTETKILETWCTGAKVYQAKN